ncbi:exonuclease domain-containing protein [Sutcliffiella deserti]|uniref:exonuclease domain-containing protein n=1 Tax=Sutcliffiella deserti TaxID=2875501 RepID=UPI001CC0827A|nr:exonuclease domain-containing protein [Sutcliffiella deserti]
MKQRYVVLDLETTGNSPKKQDKIIQVGAVLIEDGEIIERFASFVNPNCRIPPFIEQLTCINNTMVKKAPTFGQIAPMLSEMLEGAALVAHNVPFDLSFLQHELVTNGYSAFSGNTIDTVELARILLPTQKSYKLNDLAEFYQLNHDNPHRADSDAEVTAIIFLNLLEKIRTLPSLTNRQLNKLSHNMKSDIYILFNESSLVDSKDYYIYENRVALRQFSTSSPISAEQTKEKILLFLKKEESAAVKDVNTLFKARQHGLLEMSLDLSGLGEHYLLGALLFALDTEQKVVISSFSSDTGTKIQELLSDLHKLNIDISYHTSAIKGKYFYLSLPLFLKTLEQQEDNYDAVLTKSQILVWLTETLTGDMEELSLSSGGRLLWESINCTVKSKSNQGSYCFYQQAMKKFQSSKLIFTNHSFLAKEIWKPDVLKACDYFIVDDANVFYQNVSRFLGKEISYLDLYFTLSKLSDNPLVQQAKEELDEMFRILRGYSLSKTKTMSSRISYRYDILREKGPTWLAVQEAAQRLYMKLTDVIHALELTENGQRVIDDAKDAIEQESVVLKTMRDTFYSLLFVPDKSRLTWFEVNVRGAKNSVTILEEPLDISLSLAEKFYQVKSSVIFISPALSVNQSFDFIVEELGLTDFYPTSIRVPDSSRMLPSVYIPADMPIISKGKNEKFIQTAALQIRELHTLKGGRVLVAFSSIEMLSSVYNELKNSPSSNETIIVSQSSISGGKQKILKAAANFDQAILLVTNSFLEEVSIKKEQIDTLVLIRLPFKAMDEPVMASKIDRVEKQGRNSFTDVSLPIAVIRFKKMIASFLEGKGQKDIFIFDKRVIEKRYGDQFLEAIPNAIVKKDSFFSLLNRMNS